MDLSIIEFKILNLLPVGFKENSFLVYKKTTKAWIVDNYVLYLVQSLIHD